MLKKLFVMIAIGSALHGGKVTAPPPSPIVPIEEKPEPPLFSPYAGFSVGSASLYDKVSREKFTYPIMILSLGLDIKKYNFMFEGRAGQDWGKMKYRKGVTPNPDSNDFPADFRYYGAYIKPYYLILDDLMIYGVGGYGVSQMRSIPLGAGGATRTDDGFQWGSGFGYCFEDNTQVNVEYFRFFNHKGFDGRAVNSGVINDGFTIGFQYNF